MNVKLIGSWFNKLILHIDGEEQAAAAVVVVRCSNLESIVLMVWGSKTGIAKKNHRFQWNVLHIGS